MAEQAAGAVGKRSSRSRRQYEHHEPENRYKSGKAAPVGSSGAHTLIQPSHYCSVLEVKLQCLETGVRISHFAKALVQNLLAFVKGVFAKCILRRHNIFNLVAALVLGRLLLRALRNCEKIMH